MNHNKTLIAAALVKFLKHFKISFFDFQDIIPVAYINAHGQNSDKGA